MINLRLNKFLAHCGAGSRRQCDTYIQRGRVQVNDTVCVEPGRAVEPGVDVVLFDGDPQRLEKNVYFRYYKPVGQATTLGDPHIENTLEDVVAKIDQRVYPVGRLDQDSRGLLLLTNDGDLSHKLTHPSGGVAKIYEVELNRSPAASVLQIMSEKGVHLDGRQTLPVKFIDVEGNELVLQLKEGRNRQIRRMFEKFNYKVTDLLRTSIGPLTLEGLQPGELEELDEATVEKLREGAYE
ncbi:MAG: pseudouridine synthase [bacterium]